MRRTEPRNGRRDGGRKAQKRCSVLPEPGSGGSEMTSATDGKTLTSNVKRGGGGDRQVKRGRQPVNQGGQRGGGGNAGQKKGGGRESAAARDTAPPRLLGDADAHTVLFDPGERLDGVAPALGADTVGSDAGLFQCRCDARGTLPREFQVEGVRTRSGIGIADDLDPGGRIGLQVLGKRCDLRLFGGADLRRTDTEEDIFTQCCPASRRPSSPEPARERAPARQVPPFGRAR